MDKVIYKYNDRLVLPFTGSLLSTVQLSTCGLMYIYFDVPSLRPMFQCHFQDCDASLHNESVIVDVAADIGREHIWSLLGRLIEHCILYNQGDLQFSFDNDLEILIHPKLGFEHWELELCSIDSKFSCSSNIEGGYSMSNKLFKVVEIPDEFVRS